MILRIESTRCLSISSHFWIIKKDIKKKCRFWFPSLPCGINLLLCLIKFIRLPVTRHFLDLLLGKFFELIQLLGIILCTFLERSFVIALCEFDLRSWPWPIQDLNDVSRLTQLFPLCRLKRCYYSAILGKAMLLCVNVDNRLSQTTPTFPPSTSACINIGTFSLSVFLLSLASSD
jgi:hypothetical protein